ncbi:MAG: YggT family protein [Acidimicrobiales bacterium]
MGVLKTLLLLYVLAIIGVIVFSWFPQTPESPMYRVFLFLRRITDPVLLPLRRIIPPVGGVVDLSPTIVIIVLLAVRNLI